MATTDLDASTVIVRGRAWPRFAYDRHLQELKALREAEVAYRTSDADAFFEAVVAIDPLCDGWGRLFRRIARIDTRPSAAFRRRFLQVMITHGDHIRQESGNDLDLIQALPAIFPPYKGPALHLYRGEGAWNRRCRTYGFSWTLDRQVAKKFARRLCSHGEGGSVVIETHAPSGAIIRIVRGGHHSGEREVWVNRRHLERVLVLERYPQLPHTRP